MRNLTFTELNLSRRHVLKGAGALVLSSAMAGCSKNDGETYQVAGGQGEPITPEEELHSIPSGAGRACGGMCIVKAQVKNGVVRRFVSDDIHDEEISKSHPFGRLQSRACLKCRSWKYMMYNTNRLLYPLIQTGERGDLSGFRVAGWDEAMALIKERTDHIRKTYGPGAVLNEQAGGNGGYGAFFLGISQMMGGALTTRQDFSQACWEHVGNFVRPQRFTDFGVTWAPGAPFDDSGELKTNPAATGRDPDTGWIKSITGYNIVANAITDYFNADHIVLWSGNPAEVFGVHHANYYLKRMKEEGIEFTVVDQRVSPSVTAYADNFISPVQNTDTALILAVIHSMLKDHLGLLKERYGLRREDANILLKAEIEKWMYGFFDTGSSPTSYHAAATVKNQAFPLDFPVIDNTEFAGKYAVPDGGSWSAYIFGNSNYLVEEGFNNNISIYPDKIGYCVRDYDYPGEGADPLKGKYVPCYGQVEKTPEWAAQITGVPAETIRAFAEKLLMAEKTSFYIGFGFQRHHEGEQGTWSLLLLSTLIRSFGASGQSIGIPRAPGYIPQNDRFNALSWLPAYHLPAAGYMNSVYADIGRFHKMAPGGYLDDSMGIDYEHLGFHDGQKLSFPSLTDDYTRFSIPVKEMYDMIGATNQPKVQTKTLRRNAAGTDWEERMEEVYPSLWNDGQVQRLPKPVRAIFVCGSNKLTSNGADVNRTVRAYHETDPDSKHPKKYKIELVTVIDSFMTGTARYADVILPSAATSEKFITPISVQGNEVVNLLSAKAVEPLGEALNDIDMGERYYKQWETEIPGITDAYFGTLEWIGYPVKGICRGDDTMSANEKVVKSLWEANPDEDKPTYEEWKRTGVWYADKYASRYGRETLIPADPGQPSDFPRIDHKKDVFIWNQEFRLYPDKYPLHSPSGRVEAYCQAMVEDFEARNFYNYDPAVVLKNGGQLRFAGTPSGWETYGRYVYPVPMYIPAVEGRHACDTDATAPATDVNNPAEAVTSYTKHPNPLGFSAGFDYVMCNHHPIQRAHTLHNSNPVINELFKYDAQGKPAFYGSAGAGEGGSAPQVMTAGVYEPVLIGEGSTYADGGEIKNGDLVIVESLRGKGMFSAKVTKRIKPYHITIAQGSAYNPAGHKGEAADVDLGGSTGTHISHRPSRFGRGFTASDIRVKITKGA